MDINELKRKFPSKNAAAKREKAKALRAIAHEYERKRAEVLRQGPPVMRKGFLFYGIVIFALLMVGGLVIRGTMMPQKVQMTKAAIDVRRSIDALAEALGRYRYHVGTFPTTAEGLAQLAALNVAKPGWNGPYINHVVKDPWGNDYVYVYNGETEMPTLYSRGPDRLKGTSDDVLPEPALFEKAFKDTRWTKGWMPQHLRGYVLAPDARTKRILQEEVRRIENPDGSVTGERPLSEGWKPETSATQAIPAFHRGFNLSPAAENCFVALRFAGVSSCPGVHLNGVPLTGYAAGDVFEVDLSGKAKPGANELTVFAPEGAGVLRGVTLAVEDRLCRVVCGSLRVTVREITEDEAHMRATYAMPVRAVTNDFSVAYPRLWRPDFPYRYTLPICGKDYKYGICVAACEPDGRFVFNGEELPIRGADLDMSRLPRNPRFARAAVRRALEKLKDMGVNAVRVEKPADPVLVELCDEMGVFVCGPADAQGAMDVDGLHPSRLPVAAAAQTPFVSATLDDIMAKPGEKHYRQRAKWNESDMTLRLFPHWNWEGHEGEKITVTCFTDGDAVELFLNGESQGRRVTDADARCTWEVPYEPGELKAIAYREDSVMGETVCKTAYRPFALRVSAEKTYLAEGETAFAAVAVVDDEGAELPTAQGEVTFALEGPGEIVAVGNGASGIIEVENGRASVPLRDAHACVAIRRRGGSGLPLRLTASMAGVRAATLALPRRPEQSGR